MFAIGLKKKVACPVADLIDAKKKKKKDKNVLYEKVKNIYIYIYYFVVNFLFE